MSALAVMDGYEANVGLDEDVRMEAFLILQALTSPNDLGPFIKQAVEDFPQSVNFQLCLAEWHVTVDELDDASAILEPMVAKDPNDGRVRFSLAQIATKRNQLDEAFVHLMKAFPSNDVALEDKLRVLIGYGILAQSDPEFVEPYESLLDVLMTHHGPLQRVGATKDGVRRAEGLVLVADVALGAEALGHGDQVLFDGFAELTCHEDDVLDRFVGRTNDVFHQAFHDGLARHVNQGFRDGECVGSKAGSTARHGHDDVHGFKSFLCGQIRLRRVPFPEGRTRRRGLAT